MQCIYSYNPLSEKIGCDMLKCGTNSVIGSLGNTSHYGIGERRLLIQKDQISDTGWKNQRQSRGLWMKQENQRQFFDWLGNQLGYKEMDDWYKVTQEDIHKHGGSGLLHNYYHNSPAQA